MKRKIVILIVCILCVSLLFSACSPRLVGEAKAKEAGLAFINMVFDVNETEAVVEYHEYVGVTYEDGYAIQYGTEEPDRVYVIKVNPNEIGNFDYYAEVNAVTGEAYRADKAWELLKPMTAEQQVRVDELYTHDETWSSALFEAAEPETGPEAMKWFQDKFHPDAPMLPMIYPGSSEDEVLRHAIDVEYYVVLRDGTIYLLSMVWPTFEILMIERIN